MFKDEKFWDKWGTLDASNHRGGDSGHRVGLSFSLLGMMSPNQRVNYLHAMDFYQKFALHHVDDGVFIRHPNPDRDVSDWDRMSRDQLHPMIIAAGYWDQGELNRIIKGHLKRGFIFTNNTRRNGADKHNHRKIDGGEMRDYGWKLPDITGPDVWGNFIRAKGAWYLYPFLLIFDLDMFVSAITWRFRKDNIAMNHTISILHAMDKMPTFWSWLARKIMPVPKLIKLIDEHFHDFPDDMVFFKDMFTEAYETIIGGVK